MIFGSATITIRGSQTEKRCTNLSPSTFFQSTSFSSLFMRPHCFLSSSSASNVSGYVKFVERRGLICNIDQPPPSPPVATGAILLSVISSLFWVLMFILHYCSVTIIIIVLALDNAFRSSCQDAFLPITHYPTILTGYWVFTHYPYPRIFDIGYYPIINYPPENRMGTQPCPAQI